jgi:FkbM family methyltransferase
MTSGAYSKLHPRMLRVISRARSAVRTALNIPTQYKYKTFSIELPAIHRLPAYRQAHPNYDRFLPHLASYFDRQDTVIDVGANVGDTLAGMLESCPSATYICIEPDDTFFGYLARNIERMRTAHPGIRVHAIKALVGQGISASHLEGDGGTRHAVPSADGGLTPRTFDELIRTIPVERVRLLKTDVDGFDYDVLDSSSAVIEAHQPLVFFELYYDNATQRDGYANTLEALAGQGYCDWTVFDNFGELLLRTNDLSVLYQLMSYLWQQNAGRATRTIWYFDILAAQRHDRAFLDRVLSAYRGHSHQ